MEIIKLTQGKAAIIDKEDAELVQQFKWHARYNPSTRSFNAGAKLKGRVVLLHRLVMKAPKGMVVDHINHDTLDNRKKNLRVCTHAENMKNKKISVRQKSGFKGVFIHPETSRRRMHYEAKIKVNGKVKYLGFFKDKLEAARAYNKAASMYHGEFALLNNIPV